MWRRAGLEVEAIPGPPLRQAQVVEPGFKPKFYYLKYFKILKHRALRGSPESPVPLSCARRPPEWDPPRRAPAELSAVRWRTERRFLWEEMGVSKRESGRLFP